MAKTKFAFTASIIIGFIFIAGAIISIIEESNQNLNNCDVVTGQVIGKDIIRIKKYKYKKNHFFFKLNNSNQNFTIFRNDEGYSDLESAIKIGDTLRVYFNPTSTGYNKNVYQIEKDNVVLESINAYKKEKGTMTVLLLFAGILVILYSSLTYYNLNIGVLLMRIVDPNYKKNCR